MSQSHIPPEQWPYEYGDLLYSYAFHRIGRREVCEDLVQDCLIRGLGAWSQFRGDSQVSTWLVGILKNLIYDYFRKHSKSVEVSMVDDMDEFFLEDGHWRFETLEGEVLQRGLHAQLSLCLEGLNDRYRIPFLLKEQDELSGEEIADILGIKVNALWIILHRARLKLKQCIEGGHS